MSWLSLFEKGNPPLFESGDGDFQLSSGLRSDWRINCEVLSPHDLSTLARIAATLLPNFGKVIGVPRGGLALAKMLEPYATSGPLLIVDDVLTTGGSMERLRKENSSEITIGLVLFARGKCPNWITPIWSLAGK